MRKSSSLNLKNNSFSVLNTNILNSDILNTNILNSDILNTNILNSDILNTDILTIGSNIEKLEDYKLKNKWILWAHDNEEVSWKIDSYEKVCIINTVYDFWCVYNNFDKMGIRFMHYFLMKDGIMPIWEDPINRNGGTCSIKIDNNDSNEYQYICMRAVTDTLLNTKNDINGISISPKKKYSLIKIWNMDGKNNIIDDFMDDIIDRYDDESMRYKSNKPEY